MTDPHAEARRIAEHWAALDVGHPPVTYLAKEVLDLSAREERLREVADAAAVLVACPVCARKLESEGEPGHLEPLKEALERA